jgi:hypothetical protein
MTESRESDQDAEKRDAVLRRMLTTPKPEKPGPKADPAPAPAPAPANRLAGNKKGRRPASLASANVDQST